MSRPSPMVLAISPALALGVLAGGLVLGVGPAAAGSSQVITAAADSWVDSTAPTANHGKDSYLQVDGNPVLRAYLRFSVTVPSGRRVSSAVLRLTPLTSNSSGVGVSTVSGSWTEGGITWSSAPAPSPVVVARSGPLTAKKQASVALTGVVPAAGGTVDLALDNLSGASFGMYSREASSSSMRPQLVVTTDVATTTTTSPSPTASATTSASPTPASTSTATATPTATPTASSTATTTTTTVSPAASATASPAASASTGTTRHVYPGQSFASAVSASAAGDTVLVHNGTYASQSLTNLSKTGVTVIGESRAGVVVNGLYLSATSGVTFARMTVQNTATAGCAVVRVANGSKDLVFRDLLVAPRSYSGFEITTGSHHVVVAGSTITGQYVTGTLATNMTSRGLNIKGGTGTRDTWVHDITVTGNDIGRFGSDNVQIGGAYDVWVVGNSIHDVQENDDHNDGIQTYGSDGLRIIGNRFWAAGALGGPDQAMMIRSHPDIANLTVTNTYIANNIVAGWRGSGINVASQTWNTTVVNNTGADNGGAALSVINANPGLVIYNNVFDKVYYSGITPSAHDNCIRSGPGGTNNVSSDPLFVDRTSYALSGSSPCVDHGVLPAPATDFAGASRGTAPDAGAREYVG